MDGLKIQMPIFDLEEIEKKIKWKYWKINIKIKKWDKKK